jgi:hypothetical protein
MEASLYQLGISGNVTAQIFWLKNRRPDRWRDVQHIDQAVGHYIISDRPMTEEQWIAERTRLEPKQIEGDVSPVLAHARRSTTSSKRNMRVALLTSPV